MLGMIPVRRSATWMVTVVVACAALVLAACGGDGDLDAVSGSRINGGEVAFDYEERCEDSGNVGCVLNPAGVGTVLVHEDWTVRHAGGQVERLDAGAPGGYDFEWGGPMVAILYLEVTNGTDGAREVDRLAGDTALMSMGTMSDCTPDVLPAGGSIEPGETLTLRVCGNGGSDGTVSARVRFPCSRCEAELAVYPGAPVDDDVLDAVTGSVTLLEDRTPDGAALSRWEEEVVWLRAARDGGSASGGSGADDALSESSGDADDRIDDQPPAPPATSGSSGSGTMPTSGDDVALITGFWHAYASTWVGGEAFQFMAANNYPAMGDDPDACRDGIAPVVELRDVEVGASRPDPGWSIPGAGPMGGVTPDGEIFATEIHAAYVLEDGTETRDSDEVHSTIVDGDIHGFFPCEG